MGSARGSAPCSVLMTTILVRPWRASEDGALTVGAKVGDFGHMQHVSRQSTDPRSESTRAALIEAAESLFARFGFDAVSLRQIGAAIGAGNTRVVAYHFGAKEDLIEAIYRHRLPAIDQRRRELLEEAEAQGLGHDLGTLTRVLSLPWFEQTDADGIHSYGRFLCAMQREGRGPAAHMLDDPSPATTIIWERISAQLPVPKGPLLALRIRITTAMMLDTLRLIDSIEAGKMDGITPRSIFDDAMAMTLGAMLTPAPAAS